MTTITTIIAASAAVLLLLLLLLLHYHHYLFTEFTGQRQDELSTMEQEGGISKRTKEYLPVKKEAMGAVAMLNHGRAIRLGECADDYKGRKGCDSGW